MADVKPDNSPELARSQGAEIIPAVLPEITERTCPVIDWLGRLDQDAYQLMEFAVQAKNGLDPGKAMLQIGEARDLARTVTEIKNELCTECPKALCPIIDIMSILQRSPLKDGAQIVLDNFFNEYPG